MSQRFDSIRIYQRRGLTLSAFLGPPDGVVAGSEDIATASEDVYAGSVDTVVATEHGIGHAKAIGSAVDGIFKRMIKLPHKRYIWSSTIIQDSTPNAPPPNVNVNELGGEFPYLWSFVLAILIPVRVFLRLDHHHCCAHCYSRCSNLCTRR